MNIIKSIFFISALLLCGQSLKVLAETEELEIPVGEQDLFITQYPANGEHLLIWIAPGYGSHRRAFKMSEQLVEYGVEVWHVDLADSLFLPKNTTTMRAFDGKYIAGLIEAAYEKTGKTITLLSRSYGSLPLLRGARRWQQEHQDDKDNYLNGAILFSPELYSTVPSLGLPPKYADITFATNIPIMIYQAGNRSNRWQVADLLNFFEKSGAPTFLRLKKGVTGLLYEGDTSPVTLAIQDKIPGELFSDIKLLNKIPVVKKVVALPEIKEEPTLGLDISLKKFKGDSEPQALDLVSATGKRFKRDNYLGKVTVVNFWASWCPPCVEEIPSLNNLRKLMEGKSFELISVNYAEREDIVKQFLRKVNVDFPVLLDETGRVSADWGVLVYPSTFIITPDGKITYGVNGAILWDSPEVVKQLTDLIGNH